MDNERKDLEDINRFSSIEHERWIELLTKYSDAIMKPDVKESTRLVACALLWQSGLRVNYNLGLIQVSAHCFPEDFFGARKQLQDIVPLVKRLRAGLPDEVSNFDEIVSYGTHFERSWMMMAISAARWFTIHSSTLNTEFVRMMFEINDYDPYYVGLQLEIEKKKFERLQFCSTEGNADGKATVETTIGDALDRILRGTVKAEKAATEWSGHHPPDEQPANPQSERQNLQLQKKVLPVYPGFTEAVNALRQLPKTKGHQSRICRQVTGGDEKAAETLRTYLQQHRELWHENHR